MPTLAVSIATIATALVSTMMPITITVSITFSARPAITVAIPNLAEKEKKVFQYGKVNPKIFYKNKHIFGNNREETVDLKFSLIVLSRISLPAAIVFCPTTSRAVSSATDVARIRRNVVVIPM